MATQQPAARSKLRAKKSESVDESDESFPRSAEKPAVVKPAALTQTQVYLNFGLVGTSCTIAQGTVHWTQTTMVRQQLASAASGAEPSFVATLTGLYSSEGVLGLYRGFQSAAFREMTYSSLRFGLYEPIKGLLGASGPNSAPWQNVASGLLAGTVAALGLGSGSTPNLNPHLNPNPSLNPNPNQARGQAGERGAGKESNPNPDPNSNANPTPNPNHLTRRSSCSTAACCMTTRARRPRRCAATRTCCARASRVAMW